MKQAREKQQVRRVISWIYHSFMRQLNGPGFTMESLMSKNEFMTFTKALCGDQIRDSELTEFMIYYAK